MIRCNPASAAPSDCCEFPSEAAENCASRPVSSASAASRPMIIEMMIVTINALPSSRKTSLRTRAPVPGLLLEHDDVDGIPVRGFIACLVVRAHLVLHEVAL